MDIQEAAALAACSSLDNQRGLETLRTLLQNIVDHPHEDKFRSVSITALQKRGLTAECREFLRCIGFVEEHERLCFRKDEGTQLYEGLFVIKDLLEQRGDARCENGSRVEQVVQVSHKGSTHTTKSSAPSGDMQAIRQARLAALEKPGANTEITIDLTGANHMQNHGAAPRSEDGATHIPQSCGQNLEIEKQLVDMGFPLEKVQRAMSEVQESENIEVVLQALFSPAESPTGGYPQNCSVPPELVRGQSTQSTGSAPDMPTLERDLSDVSRQVLHTVAEQTSLSAKETARLLLSLAAGLKQEVLTPQQKEELQEDIRQGQFQKVQDVIMGLGIQATPEMMLPRGEPKWECQICREGQQTNGWRCPSNHRFCHTCMQTYIEAVPFPKCPTCEYCLGEVDLRTLNVCPARLEAFREAKLRGAVDTLAQAGECLVRCSRAECPNVVVFETAHRQRFQCEVCNAPAFCTKCRQSPYHHHQDCNRVQPLREQWLAWISGGRNNHYGQVNAAVENDRRNQALYEGIARHNELEADERWKAQNCRHCPSCNRPISKVEGCDSMVCGRAYHGGDQQPGCGSEFNWATAKPYEANIARRELPNLASESTRLRGRNVFHPFTTCSLCGTNGIAGVAFRCIHCESFDVCATCEPRLGDLHEVDHVFEIRFESDFRCPWLPRGTRVQLVRSGERAPKSLSRCTITALEGLSGTVTKRRRPPLEGYFVELDLGQGQIELDPMFLEPIIASREDAEQLLIKTLEADGEEPEPVAAAPPLLPTPGRHMDRANVLFDDDSPLSSPAGTPPGTPPRIRRQRMEQALRHGRRVEQPGASRIAHMAPVSAFDRRESL